MSNHVLLLGGSGKVAQLLTPLLLQRSWTVTSIIRNPDQVANLQKIGENQKGKLNVLVRSLEDVKNEAQAKSIIDEVNPNYVVWSAGESGYRRMNEPCRVWQLTMRTTQVLEAKVPRSGFVASAFTDDAWEIADRVYRRLRLTAMRRHTLSGRR
jgi:nucleoside-diphosphate-sugar epimerase